MVQFLVKLIILPRSWNREHQSSQIEPKAIYTSFYSFTSIHKIFSSCCLQFPLDGGGIQGNTKIDVLCTIRHTSNATHRRARPDLMHPKAGCFLTSMFRLVLILPPLPFFTSQDGSGLVHGVVLEPVGQLEPPSLCQLEDLLEHSLETSPSSMRMHCYPAMGETRS